MKILLFDDHKLFGESLSRALLEFEEIEKCEFVYEERDFESKLKLFDFDILLLDINLKASSSLNGFDLLLKTKKERPELKIVILSSYDLPLYKKKAFDNGASDFINKSIEIEDLIIRLKLVMTDDERKGGEYSDLLTESEIVILREICDGTPRKELAKKLFISERTLYNHIQNIYEKLEVHNAIEAYNKAIKLGYIEPLM